MEGFRKKAKDDTTQYTTMPAEFGHTRFIFFQKNRKRLLCLVV